MKTQPKEPYKNFLSPKFYNEIEHWAQTIFY